MKKFFKQYTITILIGVAVIFTWEMLTRYGSLNPVIFPELEKVFGVFVTDGKELLIGLVSSFKLLLPAYIGSLILGIGGGVFFGLNIAFEIH